MTGASDWDWDASVRQSSDGCILSGGHPARVLRLSPRGAAALASALDSAGATGADGASLLEVLVRYEMIHPRPAPDRSAGGRASFVVPARNAAGAIGELVTTLSEAATVIVVDDASSDETAAVAREAGADVVVHDECLGPAAARNSGLARVQTDLVAFIDADCVPDTRWVGELAPLFEDPRLAVAAPRVRSADRHSVLARYERAWSPLDMGPEPGVVGRGRRLAYVPSAALVARVSALREVGGFDPALRVGEDVDLIWRLARSRWWTRYSPNAVVLHEPRATLREAWRQRYSYGRSTAPLEQRHPGGARPFYVSAATAVVWASSLGGARSAAAGAAAATAPAALPARDPRSAAAAIELAARGHVAATMQLARSLARDWLPLTLVAAASSPQMRRVGGLALAVDALRAARRAPGRADWPAFVLLRAADNAAYCAGLWTAALDLGSAAALAPGWVKRTRWRDQSIANT
jgi:mycofactocin system glycosyltransferase